MSAPLRTLLRRRPGSPLTRLLAAGVAATVTLTTYAGVSAPAQADVTVTPGSFTGYGFDQCLAPTQSAMDAWLRSSPYWAVGIYISGDSRACRSQPNLTATWVSTQLANGWRLLPITLGPQASCNPRFPRYSDDVRINPSSSDTYDAARDQGHAEAADAVAVAQQLGIGKGSTLWYDLEAYDVANTSCRESALWFTSAWSWKLHQLGYVSGVYSSAGSGIKALDDARVDRPGTFVLPDKVWLARWDEVANTSTSYLREEGWRPGGRVKQYRGGHDETWGGVTINIDTDFLDVGKGSKPRAERSHCDGVRLSYRQYPRLTGSSTGAAVEAAQCLLTQQGAYDGAIDGVMDEATRDAVRAVRKERGLGSRASVNRRTWTSLLSWQGERLKKYGSAGEGVRRLQRALNAATDARIPVTGTFAGATTVAVKGYQSQLGWTPSGVVTDALWNKLHAGSR
jgi:peptidoglycan hydrolase-like protein with peptidoglycan-binding domain